MTMLMDQLSSAVRQATQAVLAQWQPRDRLLLLELPQASGLTDAALMLERLQGVETVGPMQVTDECCPMTELDAASSASSLAASQRIATVHGFHYELTVVCTDAHLNTGEFIGQPAVVKMQTSLSREQRRPLHGMVTGFARVAANGGLARYRLVLQSWLYSLDLRRDSYVYTDASVLSIIDSLLSDYQAGPCGAQIRWRYAMAQPDAFAVRSVTTQHHETDLQFMTRLLSEEGLYYFFEHAEDGHTLVITDDLSQFTPNAQPDLRFTQSGATLKSDGLDRWKRQHNVLPDRVVLSSWDYRRLSTRQVESASASASANPSLTLQLEPGAYAYADVEQGQRLADHVLQAFDARRQVWHGRGTVRTLCPGTTFQVRDHYAASQEPCAVIAVWHEARNNLTTGLGAAADSNDLDAWADDAEEKNDNADQKRDSDHYRNHFTALPVSTLYRSHACLHGKALYPKPTALGAQTAVVVGQDDPLHTDRDHRVQIQYHWQRGPQSSSGNTHPAGEDNAPGRSRGYTQGLWVRVTALDAGDNFGSVFVPRVGQEVVVEFLGGDLDRPVVSGAVYNGEGAADGQYNQVSQGLAALTGNAPAWFAGEQGAHAHHAALSGIKTQGLSSSQSGQGDHNQLVFDDTPGHAGARLQTTQAKSQLNLGALWQQSDNQRKAARGFGAELATRASGAVRGGSGVLITADAAAASGEQLHSDATNAVSQAQGIRRALTEHAVQQRAQLTGFNATQFDKELLEALTEKLSTTQNAGAGTSVSEADIGEALRARAVGGGTGEATAYSHPLITLSAPAGIASFSAGDTIEVTGTHRLSNASDSTLTIQGNSLIHSAQGQLWYTAGHAPTTPRAITDIGMKLHAATGTVQLRSLTDKTDLSADQSVLIASTQGRVKLTAPNNELLLTAGGAFVKLKKSALTLGAPGNITLSGSLVSYTGAQGSSDTVTLAQSQLKGCAQQSAPALDALAPF